MEKNVGYGVEQHKRQSTGWVLTLSIEDLLSRYTIYCVLKNKLLFLNKKFDAHNNLTQL